jgi:hypothetical protein
MAPKKHSPRKGKRPLKFGTNDIYGNSVKCTRETWDTHITAGHAEMIGREADAQTAIEDPDQIVPSTRTGIAFGFEKNFTSDTLRVIVYYDDPVLFPMGGTSGKVITAYADDDMIKSRVGKPIFTKEKVTLEAASGIQPQSGAAEDDE